MFLKTNVSKEDFKRAYSECAKYAWIFHSKENFEKALKLKNDEVFQYILKVQIDNDDDFDSDASAIDVFSTFEEMFKDNNDLEALDRWNKAWEAEDGFEVESYSGDSIEDGNAVGELAREYFEIKLFDHAIKKNSFDFSFMNFKDALKQTSEIMNNFKEYRYLYEPAFEFDNNNLRTRCDILELKDNGHVNIIEVKATSKVKKEHFFDLVYQTYVLEKNGYIVDDIFLMHMDNEYVYGYDKYVDLKKEQEELNKVTKNITYDEVIKFLDNNSHLLEPFTNEITEDINIERLFIVDDLTFGTDKNRITLTEAYKELKESHPLDYLFENLAKLLAIKNDSDIWHLFNVDNCITKMAYQKKEHSWFYDVDSDNVSCQHTLPWFDLNKESIFNFSGLHKNAAAFLYRTTDKVYLEDIKNLEELPLKETKNGELKPFYQHKHERHFEVYKKSLLNKSISPIDIIDKENISQLYEMLEQYKAPIYMYDFETVKWAIPRFMYTNTYFQVPFQYSVDVIFDENYDYNKPETMHHYDFIENKRIDPRPNFIINFIKDVLLKHGKGVYVAYNKSFEQGVLKKLAYMFPKYAIPLMYIANNTIDLMYFFYGSKKTNEWFLIYHPDFHGSYSIKKTQPALDPSFNYSDLKINKGDKAAQTFREFEENKIPDEAWKEVEPWMIKYCNRDTLAMVVILKQVQIAIKEYSKMKGIEYNEKI